MSVDRHVPLTAQEARGAAALSDVPRDLTTTSSLASSVPVFTPMVRDSLRMEYAERNDKLVFHIYHTERKRLVEEALVMADRTPPNPRYLQQLDADLTEALEKHPWWVNVGEKLQNVFSSFFRTSAKVVFDPEVDSWSVIVPVPELPTMWCNQARDYLFSQLYAALQQG